MGQEVYHNEDNNNDNNTCIYMAINSGVSKRTLLLVIIYLDYYIHSKMRRNKELVKAGSHCNSERSTAQKL